MKKDTIYLDYAANTPVDPAVLEVFNQTTLQDFANPNATHPLGKKVQQKMEQATHHIETLFQTYTKLDPDMEIVYTSGSSESNNLAIKGLAKAYKEYGKHIISTYLEHSSVSAPLTALQEDGYEIDLVPITREGKIDLEQLKSLLRKDTILVSVCYVDSEVGNVQPIPEIVEILKEYSNCFLHVDATQAIGKIPVNLQGVDLVTFAPHKFYGLNGMGGLWKKRDLVLEPLISGGASNTIYRSGTPVVAQICALEKALSLAMTQLEDRKQKVTEMNLYLREKLASYADVKINTNMENPYILNISVMGVKAVDFKKKLEEYGVCISIKSACQVMLTPSRIVMAMTHDRKRAFAAWRISLSHLVKKKELEQFLEIFDQCYRYFKEG